jgi:hypothetical protein
LKSVLTDEIGIFDPDVDASFSSGTRCGHEVVMEFTTGTPNTRLHPDSSGLPIDGSAC